MNLYEASPPNYGRESSHIGLGVTARSFVNTQGDERASIPEGVVFFKVLLLCRPKRLASPCFL